jgi:hypothetical protein
MIETKIVSTLYFIHFCRSAILIESVDVLTLNVIQKNVDLSCWGKIGWMENSGQKNSSLFE